MQIYILMQIEKVWMDGWIIHVKFTTAQWDWRVEMQNFTFYFIYFGTTQFLLKAIIWYYFYNKKNELKLKENMSTYNSGEINIIMLSLNYTKVQ